VSPLPGTRDEGEHRRDGTRIGRQTKENTNEGTTATHGTGGGTLPDTRAPTQEEQERAVPQHKNRPRVPHESEPDAHPKAFRGIIAERVPGPSSARVRVCIETVLVGHTWTFTRDQEVVRYIGSLRGKGIICIIISVLAVVHDFESVVRVPAEVDVWGVGETTSFVDGWGVGGNIGWEDEKEHDYGEATMMSGF